MNTLTLIIGVLACWRATSLISRERGAFAVGTRLRSLFGVFHDENGVPVPDGSGGVLLESVSRFAWVDAIVHEIAQGMTCFWCCSIWAALVINLMFHPVDVEAFVLYSLALSAGAILLDRIEDERS